MIISDISTRVILVSDINHARAIAKSYKKPYKVSIEEIDETSFKVTIVRAVGDHYGKKPCARETAVEAGQPFAAPSARERHIKKAIEKEFYDRHFNLLGR